MDIRTVTTLRRKIATIVARESGWASPNTDHLDAADKIIALVGDAEFSSWQPIATAPKDGHIIGFWKGYKRPCVMWWNFADQAFESWTDRHEAPTHWMPLPTPPSIALVDEAQSKAAGK